MNSSERLLNSCILVPSWDGYADLWDPFFQSFFTHWPDCPLRIYLGTTGKRFDDARVTSLAAPNDEGFCNNLKYFLNQVEEENVIIWIEDLFPVQKIQTGAFMNLLNQAEALDAKQLRLVDSATAVAGWIAKKNKLKSVPMIGELPPQCAYRCSLMVCWWKKEVLLDLLVANENAWDFERKGSLRSVKYSTGFYAFVGSKEPQSAGIKVVNVIRKGKVTRPGQKVLRSLGENNLVETRGLESWRKDFYLRIFRRWIKLVKFKALGKI
jgi:hypothetical protein